MKIVIAIMIILMLAVLWRTKKMINLYYSFLVFAFITTLLTLFKYQVIDSRAARKNMENKRYEIEDIYATRGSIYSYDGHKLAFDVEKFNVVLDPTNLDDKFTEDISKILSKYVGKKEQEIVEIIRDARKKGKKFYDFKLEINYDTKQSLVSDIQEYKKQAKKSGKGKLIGKWIFYPQKSERYNVEGNEFESIIGFLNNENNAVYGVEKSYDKYLKGIPGKARVYKPAIDLYKGYTLQSLIFNEVLKEPRPGYDVYLTIDSVLQYRMDEIISKVYEDFSAESVMGILMEADTGKIIAMDSYPKSTNKAEIKNRTITDLFEPGSIFKPVTVSSAIEEKLINKNTIIHSDGYVKVKDRTIHDHDRTTIGDLTITKIITHSGNVAMVKIAQLMESSIFYNYLKNFGLAQKTGIDTAFETSGKLFPLKSFTEVRKSNVSFGQGISMTQLQMLTTLNATINGGKLLKPFVVDRVVNDKGEIKLQNKTTVLHTPISEATSSQIREMLEQVVMSGTGRGIAIPGYRLGGKTGTAQKAGPHGYERGKYFSSFFAFFPADKPKYSILITVNEPHGAYYGAAVALPPAREIIEKLIKYKGIEPTYIPEEIKEVETVIKKVAKQKDLNEINNIFNMGIMPDLTGLTVRQIISISEYKKYKINFKGHGKVVNQNVKNGSKIDSNSVIILELK